MFRNLTFVVQFAYFQHQTKNRATFDTKATFWKISNILWKTLDPVFAYVYVVGGA